MSKVNIRINKENGFDRPEWEGLVAYVEVCNHGYCNVPVSSLRAETTTEKLCFAPGDFTIVTGMGG